jgi:hypothetical protein
MLSVIGVMVHVLRVVTPASVISVTSLSVHQQSVIDSSRFHQPLVREGKW